MSFIKMKINTIHIFLILFVLIPRATLAHRVGGHDDTCERDHHHHHHHSLALKYKLAALASILTAGAVGICLPMIGVKSLNPERNFFFTVKAFAAGVILSTAFIHVLPGAISSLSSPCIASHPWHEFPFGCFFAMLSSIGTLMIDTYSTGYYQRNAEVKSADVEGTAGPVHTHATHGHAYEFVTMCDLDTEKSQLVRHRIVSQVLELGIIVHSVIIGIDLGASESAETIKPLIAALAFHQFFEGIGLGGCIAQAKFDPKAALLMTILFSLTTPAGIVIGIGIANMYSETSPTALIIQGILNSVSAGILIYMSLVDLLSADFMSQKMQKSGKLQIWANLALLLGACCMSVLAKWA